MTTTSILFNACIHVTECSDDHPCEGIDEHSNFSNFGMTFLTLFRVATGDWNGIMKDTMRPDCDSSSDCIKNCCILYFVPPIYFVIFVLLSQLVLINVVVAVLMQNLEDTKEKVNKSSITYKFRFFKWHFLHS